MPQKSVLITGCSEGGIGAALAAEFQLRGCRVFATARNPKKMEPLARLGIETLSLDVNSETSIAAAVTAVREATGGSLDYLVNNAGVHYIMPFTDSKVEDLRRVIETNVVAVFAVTHAFLPLLIEAKANGGAVVATVGSVNEYVAPPFMVSYNVSKAAVHAMAMSLRVELAPFGVRFVTLVTGGVKAKLFENDPAKVPEGSRYAEISDFVNERAFLKNTPLIGADAYAKKVVSDLLKPNPNRNVWRGAMATAVWLLSCLGWEGMLDSSISKVMQLDKINS